MTRKEFLVGSAALAALSATHLSAAPKAKRRPRAITMWEFSWLERRWDGAGYEDWDRALDELIERGYDAVRIDPFPHIIGAGAEKEWTLKPFWNTQVWGAPDLIKVRVLPALLEFLGKCRDRKIKVGFSSWFQEDVDGELRKRITGPEVLAKDWVAVIDLVKSAGLLDTILYVDLCNEWPLINWASFFHEADGPDWSKPASLDYMHRAITAVRASYPQLPLLFSFCNEETDQYLKTPLPDFDMFEQHVWMVQQNNGEFYRLVNYNYEPFDPKGYTALSLKAEPTYRERPNYWNGLLTARIAKLAQASRQTGKPLATTECWAIVDYKDWPMLHWDWVKDLNAIGVTAAAATGRWLAIATSNFCGPQFVGMWRDVAWHRRMTSIIKSAPIAEDLQHGRAYERL
jgi:hypothetical protein